MNSDVSTALITGGTSGIGRAVANQLAVQGNYKVVMITADRLSKKVK